MNKNDDFDKFLKNRFQKARYKIKDDGFSEKVISNLPKISDYSIRRNFVIYVFGILSVVLFFISNGFKSLIISVIEVLNNSSHLITPSLMSLIVIMAFLSIIVFITGLEYNRSTI
ncbi:MAG: DUF5056 domain-containing protein [Bacteroidales bacterium]|nr:MAG: DUF5056 domain-containing protein [Bacteroidales bacterium]